MERMVTLICEYCGKAFERIPSRAKHGRGKHCSRKCQYAAIKSRLPKNPIRFECMNCKRVFHIGESNTRIIKGIGKYCSRRCRDEHRVRENHPQFLNGTGQERRGANWQAQRRKALKRDQEICQNCGSYGNEVHHKIPFRLFGLERYKEANVLENITTLCDKCHRSIEAEYQRKERNDKVHSQQ